MLAQLIEDLRFVIGLFFLIVSFILITIGIVTPTFVQGTQINLNLSVGSFMAAFAVFMILLSIMSLKRIKKNL